ncbi:MAG: UDP-N-acetylmuramoyl-L-alanyl-D-glutamate--2,6-diaminopimelate ligase [Candidatus Gastranaerophilales bacterium]|nr:UDP-N-acetylmuramoyl-L-alanyl-D-glutamate--2,6-diaminopimelate ligase [Candidatus Gastranaerophilales bacterium]
MNLSNIIKNIEHIEVLNFKDVDIKGISYNSNTINSHEIFVCLKGEHVDGHNFAQSAFEKGAIALMVERPLNIEIPQIVVKSTQESIADLAAVFYHNPTNSLNLIGVTGTNGKTTVAHLVQKIFEADRKKCALIGTLGYKLSSSDDYLEAKHTTPQAPQMQNTLSTILKADILNVITEVSSHALEQFRVKNCNFKTAVFTNLTQDHLDYHITMDNYFAAKAKLFKGLKQGGSAVINKDDKYAKRLIEQVPSDVEILTYSVKTKADLMAKNVEFMSDGVSFDCCYKDMSLNFKLHLNGMFSVYNCLASIAVGLINGISLETIKSALEDTKSVAGRFEIVQTNPMVIVDYAHTPDGLENILRAARELTPKGANLICLFGCGGNRDCTKRPKMGKIAQQLCDKIIITSDNPRSEDPQQIITDILSGLTLINPKTVFVEIDRKVAIELLKDISSENDVLVLAGKGHENYQILADKTIHFDDREEVIRVFSK